MTAFEVCRARSQDWILGGISPMSKRADCENVGRRVTLCRQTGVSAPGHAIANPVASFRDAYREKYHGLVTFPVMGVVAGPGGWEAPLFAASTTLARLGRPDS